MFAISINGKYLDLGESTIRWETVNTLFEESAYQADYSFPLNIPITPVNMNALGFINIASVPKAKVDFPVVLHLANRTIKSLLIVNGCGSKGFSVSIAGGLLGLPNAKKSLRDLNYITATNDGIVHRPSLQAYGSSAWDHILAFPPYYNPSFYGDANTLFQGVVNRMETEVGQLCINYEENENKYCHVPFLFIHYILKTIFAEAGVKIGGDFIFDPQMAKALWYYQYALDKREEQGSKAHSLYGQTNSFLCDSYHGESGRYVSWSESWAKIAFNDREEEGGYDPQGNWNNNTREYVIPADGDYQIDVDLFVEAMLLQVGTDFYFGDSEIRIIYEHPVGSEDPDETVASYSGPNGFYRAKFTGTKTGAEAGGRLSVRLVNLPTGFFTLESTDRDFYLKYRIHKLAANNVQSSILIKRVDVEDLNIMDTDITVKNHVHDITVEEFLNILKNWAKIDYVFNWDSRECSMNYVQKMLTRPAQVDLTDLADPNPEQNFNGRNKGYIFRYDFGSQDELVDGNFKDINFDDIKFKEIRDTEGQLTTPTMVGELALVRNKNKIMQSQIVSSVLKWVDYCDNYYPITVGKGEVDIKVELAPMLMTTAQTNENALNNANKKKALMPTISETGNSPLFNLGVDNSSSYRVMFFYGLNQTESVGGRYLLASSGNIDLNGNIVGDYSLRIEGIDGWHERFHKKILTAIDGAELFEYMIMLPISYLQYRVVQIKNVNYLVKNISTSIGKTIKQSLCKLLKI